MIILIKLILAHLIGDFPLQPKKWVKAKEEKKLKSWVLYFHVILHGLLVLLFLGDLKLWTLALSITVGHFIIDLSKLYLQKEENKSAWFIADQFLHLLLIFGLWAFWFMTETNLKTILQSDAIIIYITAIFFLTQPVAMIMSALMKKWSSSLKDENEQSLNNAGMFIGILERLFVFGFIVTTHWEAVGFLLAAKSVFRFGDMRDSNDRKLTEYILIGTLFSFGIAFIIGLIVNALMPPPV